MSKVKEIIKPFVKLKRLSFIKSRTKVNHGYNLRDRVEVYLKEKLGENL